ncbi:MAG TPA: nuclear transport factor 2 family protein [Pyrinomonadaceae bacterium]|jgi:hypothetical protein|nr:nuclear transport factor 2 family protein [Pyrinomonadaceae bacterium]
MEHRFAASSSALTLAALAVASAWLLHAARASPAQQRSVESDRRALVELENEWLRNEHDGATLERILAPDFVHPVPTGDFLTKAQHIFYSTKYKPPANLRQRFENLSVRVYGDVGIANGVVVTSDERGQEVDRSIFTDVFAYRGGRWQAVNAQENRVEQTQRRNGDE